MSGGLGGLALSLAKNGGLGNGFKGRSLGGRNGGSYVYLKLNVVPAAGVEPATFRSGGERSNPLSYAGLNKIAGFKEVPKKCPPFLPLFVPLVNYSLDIERL